MQRSATFPHWRTATTSLLLKIDQVVQKLCNMTMKEATETKSKRKTIRFNVGGTHYEVSRDTLERCEASMLASLVSDHWKEGNSHDEIIFIDRNGLLFQYVFDYLRNNKLQLPCSVSRAAVKGEFEYYGIDADMSQVIDKYGHMYLRALKKRICDEKTNLESLENEARAIQASTFVENESFKQQLPAQISIPTEYMPFDLDTLRECAELKGLMVAVCTSSARSSNQVTVKEIAR